MTLYYVFIYLFNYSEPEEVRGVDPFEVKLKALDDEYHSEWK